MARKGTKSKIGVTDLAAAWRAGWSPADVNAVLDRLDEIGDPNDPITPPADEPETPPADEVETPAEENLDLDEDEDEEDEDVAAVKSNLDKLQQTALEVENNRLKQEIERLQAANRRKDVSGEIKNVSLEDSLINRFQSIFN